MSGYRPAGIAVLVALMTGLLFFGCAAFEEDAYTGPADGYITGLVTGVPQYQETEDSLVRTADPIAGVRVFTDSGEETFTDEAGYFLLQVQPARRIVVHFEKENHTSSIKTTSVGDWQTSTVMAVLKQREVFQVSNIQNGAAIVTNDGVAVTIQNDTLVLPSGEPASGLARVSCTLINPRNRGELEAAPGDMTAVDPRAPGPSLLRSYGMLEVAVTQDGEPLAFRDGTSATVTVPFSQALPNDDPRQQGAPLWYFDQKQARWIQQGDARVVDDGDGARFEVTVTPVDDYDDDYDDDTDDSYPDGGVDGGDPGGGDRPPWKPPTYPPKWWNIDVYGDPTGIKGKVVDAVDNGLPGAQVMVYVPADGQHTYTHSGDGGRFDLYPVLANALNEVFAMLVVGSQAYTSALHHYNTTKTSPDPSTYEWVPIKDDQTSTIEIPVCFLAGYVHISHTTVRAGEEENEATMGFAQFHNILGGRDWCVDSFFKDEEEECRIVKLNEMQKLMQPGPEPHEYYSAGSHVSVKGGGQEYYLVQKQIGEDISYEDSSLDDASRRPVFEKNYNVSAPGHQGGLPQFTSNVPLFMPKQVSPLGVLRETDPAINAGRSLDLIWESSESTHHIYFMAHADPGGDAATCLVCRMRDDGHYSVPASMLGSLGKGPATFMLFRYFVDYFALPSGAAVETVGQVGVSIQGELF